MYIVLCFMQYTLQGRVEGAHNAELQEDDEDESDEEDDEEDDDEDDEGIEDMIAMDQGNHITIVELNDDGTEKADSDV